jgi:hypothetical protein
MGNRLDLLVPGLLGPLPEQPGDLMTPTLDLLLARGEPDHRHPAGLEELLLESYAATCSAPYALAADAPGLERDGWWLHAAPVHLRPDRDLLRLYDARHLGISRAEAEGLIGALNATFSGDGLHFHAPTAGRWYVRCDDPWDMRTTPLEAVVGDHIDGSLPSGPDAPRWAALMSEIQMLLFQAEPNRRREAEGRPTVNGLWCWGGGDWQPLTGAPWLAVGDDPLLQGLASAADRDYRRDPGRESTEVLRDAGGHVLVLWRGLSDALFDQSLDAWSAAAGSLEHWVAPLPAALRSGSLDELRIHSCGGKPCTVVRRDSLRWYRGWFGSRPQALGRLARASDPAAV